MELQELKEAQHLQGNDLDEWLSLYGRDLLDHCVQLIEYPMMVVELNKSLSDQCQYRQILETDFLGTQTIRCAGRARVGESYCEAHKDKSPDTLVQVGCRYLYLEEGRNYSFCGQETVSGSEYCKDHQHTDCLSTLTKEGIKEC